MSYLVRCECGLEIPVGAASAGATLVCDCGRTVALPSLGLLKQLPQSDAPPKTLHSARPGLPAAAGPGGTPPEKPPKLNAEQPKLNAEQLEVVASLARTMRFAGYLLLAAAVLQIAVGILLLLAGRGDVFIGGVLSAALAALTLRAAQAFGSVPASGDALPPLVDALLVLRSLYFLQAAMLAVVFVLAMLLAVAAVMSRVVVA